MADDNEAGEPTRRSFVKAAGVLGVAATTGLTAGTGSAAADSLGFPGATDWTREQAEQIERTPETTAPLIDESVERLSEDQYIWDTWPLRNRDGSLAKVNGYQIIFSLTATNDVVPGARHNLASIRYFYSHNGHDWQQGGEVFDAEAALGHHQWAGSAMYDEETGDVNVFYTAVSAAGEYRQRLAVGTGASVETSGDGVEITGGFDHGIIAEADGERYQTLEQSRDQGIIYAFRDPWFFKHPETGEEYVLFEGNTPIENPSEYTDWNGNVGIAKATGEGLDEWELQEPLVEAITVNQQLERPHIVVSDGNYYLFTISHRFTFAPGLTGPDGLYGFVADSLDGDYEPLNEGGLVVSNPESAPFQTYSWLALPMGDNLAVTSFYNFRETDSLQDVGSLPPDEQKRLFGGTLAPSLQVRIDDTETEIVREMKDGYFSPAIGSQQRGNGKGWKH